MVHEFAEKSLTVLPQCNCTHLLRPSAADQNEFRNEGGNKQPETERHRAHAIAGTLTRHPLFLSAKSHLNRLRNHSRYTFRHSIDVASLSLRFGMELELNQDTITQITLGALMHDIGKIQVPKAILDKPGRLVTEETTRIREHVNGTRRILEHLPGITSIAFECAALHHERLDGSGYPFGFAGKDIPIHAQIVAIADTYDAMTSERPYHNQCSPTDAVRVLMDAADRLFHKEMVVVFSQMLGTPSRHAFS